MQIGTAQIGLVGLDRSGAKTARPLMKAWHSSIVWDADFAALAAVGKDGAPPALAGDETLEAFSDELADFGECRWMAEAAIEGAVPADERAASLFTPFRSRKQHTFAEKILSAMRFGSGGQFESRKEWPR